MSNPIENLAMALGHAMHVGLADITYETRDFDKISAMSVAQQAEMRKLGQYPTKTVVSRPKKDSCIVLAMFLQTWSSTALGFNGWGGQAITQAYTTVIQGPERDVAVYWAGQFAYRLDFAKMTEEQRSRWAQDLAENTTARHDIATSRYGALASFKDS